MVSYSFFPTYKDVLSLPGDPTNTPLNIPKPEQTSQTPDARKIKYVQVIDEKDNGSPLKRPMTHIRRPQLKINASILASLREDGGMQSPLATTPRCTN